MFKRAAFRDITIPNDNTPEQAVPGTVGPPSAVPGDPNGVGWDPSTPDPWPAAGRLPPIHAAPWSGWPAEWATPNWQGQVQSLTDTAWACLDSNSSTLSTMPPYLVGAADSLNSDWLNNPDPDQYTCWEEFAKQAFWDFQNAGEVFILATAYYASGWPARFHVVPPWNVDADINGAGRRQYVIGDVDVTADMLHIRYTSHVGDARGHGPLEIGAPRLVAASALARYAGNVGASGGIPNSVLTHPQRLNPEQAADLQGQWITARMNSLGLPAVLSGGVDFKTLQLSPKDMALVELSQWNDARIAILLKVPPFCMGLPSGGDSMTYCLSDDTEALTKRGWVNVDELTTDDWMLTLDHETGLSEWQHPTAVNVFDVEDAEMHSMDSRSMSCLSTLDHRWPVVKRGSGDRTWTTSAYLNGDHNIVMAAPCVDVPTEAKYSDAFVELLAWFTTEGYVNRTQRRQWSTIGQSEVQNPTNVVAIRAALTAMFGPARVKGGYDRQYVSLFGDDCAWVEDHNRRNGMVSFRLNHEATMLLLSAVDGDPFVKAVSIDFLLSLTLAQLHLFIDTCVAGDGSTSQGRGDQRVFIQKDPVRIERFRLACTLAGIATSLYPRTGSDTWSIGVKKRSLYNPVRGVKIPPEIVRWSGRVWCPTTPAGTWYARRDGREFFTGNSNVTSLFDYRWRDGLRPMAQTVMAALSGWCLPRGTIVELDRDEYIRPGPLERAQTADIWIRNGVVTPEEVRRSERFAESAAQVGVTGDE